QLPRRGREPLGRDTELAALADAVAAGGPVQVWGPEGVGKSALLRHAVRRLEAGQDGVVFLSASGRDSDDVAQDLFEACYDTSGYAPTRGDLQRMMTGVRVLVVIDDADLPAERLAELADAAPDAVFVFASVDRSLSGEGTAMPLGGLGREA